MRGVDTAAEMEALLQVGRVVSHLSESLMKWNKNNKILQRMQDGQVIPPSAVKLDAGFQAGLAMARSRMIYCQSSGTVVVRSDLKKGRHMVRSKGVYKTSVGSGLLLKPYGIPRQHRIVRTGRSWHRRFMGWRRAGYNLASTGDGRGKANESL